MVTGVQYLESARKYEGAGYSQAANKRTGPDYFDCSGLVWRAAHDLDIDIAQGTVAQGQTLTSVPLVRALVTPGAILWRDGHDGVSYGDTRSIEARNYQYGVKTLDYRFGRFTHGLFIPGITYSTPYPYTALLVDGDYGLKTDLAWKWWLRLDGGYLDADINLALQRWLKSEKLYKGSLDGVLGPISIGALQEALKDAGVYSGAVDGLRGPMTIKAEQTFLNNNRRALTS